MPCNSGQSWERFPNNCQTFGLRTGSVYVLRRTCALMLTATWEDEGKVAALGTAWRPSSTGLPPTRSDTSNQGPGYQEMPLIRGLMVRRQAARNSPSE